MTRPALTLPSVAALHDARERLRGLAVRTPLVRLHGGPGEVWLKCENLQPIGSFKIRGAGNAIRRMDPATLQDGVVTASAGNMAQGVAWCARDLGVPCRVIVPDNAPRAKLDASRRWGRRPSRAHTPTGGGCSRRMTPRASPGPSCIPSSTTT